MLTFLHLQQFGLFIFLVYTYNTDKKKAVLLEYLDAYKVEKIWEIEGSGFSYGKREVDVSSTLIDLLHNF